MQRIKGFSIQTTKKVMAAILIIYAMAVLTVVLSENCYASGFNGEESNVGSILQTLALGGGAVNLPMVTSRNQEEQSHVWLLFLLQLLRYLPSRR